VKKLGFLSFGHWTASLRSQTRSAADALLQSIELAVAAEELGEDGAYFRIHHFARQVASRMALVGVSSVPSVDPNSSLGVLLQNVLNSPPEIRRVCPRINRDQVGETEHAP
jgi:alkanesulfonate monooxygenase SsuD/methylene tetrahydromethanopterin reductase-like flavin-dependent oxidoreductase (luciferase family)